MTIQTVSLNRAYGGTQGIYRHASRETATEMVAAAWSQLSHIPDCGAAFDKMAGDSEVVRHAGKDRRNGSRSVACGRYAHDP